MCGLPGVVRGLRQYHGRRCYRSDRADWGPTRSGTSSSVDSPIGLEGIRRSRPSPIPNSDKKNTGPKDNVTARPQRWSTQAAMAGTVSQMTKTTLVTHRQGRCLPAMTAAARATAAGASRGSLTARPCRTALPTSRRSELLSASSASLERRPASRASSRLLRSMANSMADIAAIPTVTNSHHTKGSYEDAAAG